jgi:hypothetical protein
LNSTSGTSRGFGRRRLQQLDGCALRVAEPHSLVRAALRRVDLDHAGSFQAFPQRVERGGGEAQVVQLLRGCLDHAGLLLVAAGAAGHQPASFGCRLQTEAAQEVVGDVEAGHGQGVVVQTGDPRRGR